MPYPERSRGKRGDFQVTGQTDCQSDEVREEAKYIRYRPPRQNIVPTRKGISALNVPATPPSANNNLNSVASWLSTSLKPSPMAEAHSAPEPETLEVLLARHRKEQRDLV